MAELNLDTLLTLPLGEVLALIGGALLLGGLVGWLVTGLLRGRRISSLETAIEMERRNHEQRIAEMDHVFGSLAADALKSNNQAFLQLAKESLGQLHVRSQADMEKREQSVSSLVQPIREALQRSEQQMAQIENDRRQAYGALHKHLEEMADTQRRLQGETRNLVQALRRPEVRGQWGEMTLRRLVELSGMVNHCDFTEQPSAQGEGGVSRPDMVVRLPAGRELVLDAKTPLDAYLSATEASDAADRERFLKDHARNLRARIKELAAKAYWEQFPRAPDFVILFIPGDQFLNAALETDPTILENALTQRIVLATPTSLVALLRAVAFGWRQEALAENAERIRDVGESLFQRLTAFAGHLSRLGRSLEGAVSNYNKAVGSFDAKVLPGARRFSELGLKPKKELEEPAQIELGTREVSTNEKDAPEPGPKPDPD
ncbi:MAG: DNA recombination protein RmuC [Gammaproteobacteria bacterium]|nr:DNA recombination protein RmuC [Gammaproteobacteria bacterium]